jgi:hypothetical protein
MQLCTWITGIIQADQKVSQPILKYLFMVAIQYKSIELLNTILLWLYRSPCRSCHVVTSRQSVSCLQKVEVQGCLLHKCNECSLSMTIWHLILTQLARMSLEKHFPIILCKTTRQYHVWWTVSVTQEACKTSLLGCIKHEEKSECMHCWTQWIFPMLNITLFFVFWFYCNLFFDK